MISIDGSLGEGGGQILRTALGLSMYTGQPFRIDRIRAGRAKPGLQRQHLTCVTAAATMCNATLDGASLHSSSVTFAPGKVVPGTYTFDIGSAGSTMLLLQALLPALVTAGAPTHLTLCGGTHNTLAPPYDFLHKAFFPLLRQMKANVHMELDRPGFYKAGGGVVSVMIEPVLRLHPLTLIERGELIACQATAIVSQLPESIAQRELAVVEKRLGWHGEQLNVQSIASAGPGNVLSLVVESKNVTEVFTGFGQRGARAEKVASEAINEAQAYLNSTASVGPHLADQLLNYLAIAGGGFFATLPLTEHARTNIATIGYFLPTQFTTRTMDGLCIISAS